MKKIIILIGSIIIIAGIAFFIIIGRGKKDNTIIEPGIIKNTTEANTEISESETKLNIDNEGGDVVITPPMIMQQDNNGNTDSTEYSETVESSTVDDPDKFIYETLEETEEQTFSAEELKAQQEELNKIESQMAENVAINTHNDAIAMYRDVAKANVKELVSKDHTEFNGITDEMIDNYSEEELMHLIWQIAQIN